MEVRSKQEVRDGTRDLARFDKEEKIINK